MKILKYEEFSKIVPEETKKFVDKFLEIINFEKINSTNFEDDYKCYDGDVIPLFIVAASCNLIDSKMLLENYGYNLSAMNQIVSDISLDYTKKNEDIEKYFNLFAEFFCVYDKQFQYHYLTPEKIVLKNLYVIQNKEYRFKSDAIRLESMCFRYGLSGIIEVYSEHVKKKEKKKQDELKIDFFSKLPIETINFLESATIHQEFITEIYENILSFDDIISLSLFSAIFDNDDCNYIVNYLSNFGVYKNDVFNTIEKIINTSFSFSSNQDKYDIGNLIESYDRFIDPNGENKIYDIVKKLVDRNISNSFLVEKILNKLNLPIEIFDNLEEKIKEYKENECSIEEKKIEKEVLNRIYTKLPLNIINYIEFVSLIYNEIKENKDNVKMVFSDNNILSISVFLSCYYKDQKIASYFVENGVTLDKFLSYFKLNKINLKDKKVNFGTVKFVYENLIEKTIIDIDKLKKGSQSINDIILERFSINDTTLKKILGDISLYYLDKDYIKEDLQKSLKLKYKNKQFELSKKFYGDLDLEVIKYIESSYLTYKSLKKSLAEKYTNDDLIELSLLLTFMYNFDDNGKSIYVRNKLFKSDIREYLHFSDIQKVENISTDKINMKELSKYYGKYIFGGKNKNKNRNKITINDIFNNLFNKELNDSYMLRRLLNNYKLKYDDFLSLDEKYEKYEINEILGYKSNANIEVLNNIDKIYRVVEKSEKLKYSDRKAAVCSISTIIYLYYFENDIVGYLLNRGITLEKICEYLNISKDEINKFKELETDYQHIDRNMVHFCYAGNISDVIKQRINNKSSYQFHGILSGLTEYVGTDIEELDYELLNGEKYDDYLKRKCLKLEKEQVLNLQIIDNSLKILSILKDNCNNIKDSKLLYLTFYIYLYYFENDMVDFLLNRGITLEKICEYINVPKEEIDKFKDLKSNYKEIYKVFSKNNYKIKSKSIDEIIKMQTLNEDNDNSIFNDIIRSTGNDVNDVYYELTNKQRLLSREEKIEEYSKIPIPKLEINKIEEISDFGSTLTEQSELITKEFLDFVEEKTNNEVIIELQESIDNFSKDQMEKPKLFLFRKKKKEDLSQKINNKKEFLNRLSNFFQDKEISLQEGIKSLQYIRKSIGVYLTKAESYLNVLNDAKEELDEEIKNKNYVENDFRVYDDRLKQQILTDKIASISSSIIQMLQQYQKVTMQMSTHATILNQVNLARNTTLQNLYIELALNEEISKEKESIESLNSLIDILGNMNLTNESNMVENIEKINQISKNNQNIEISENDKLIMEQILREQDLLPNQEKVKKI